MTSPTKLSLSGLTLTFLAAISYIFLLDISFIRRTAIPNWPLVIIGMALAIYGLYLKRTWITGPAGVVAVLAGGMFLISVFKTLPSAGPVAATAQVLPEFTMPNQDGRPVTLSSFHGRGPVLLVFYRGHW